MALGATNMYAQDYDLQGLAKLCQKYELSSFHDGLCKAFDQERGYLFFDTKGKEVLCVSSDEVLDFSDGLLSVKNIDGKYGYLDNFYGFTYEQNAPQPNGLLHTATRINDSTVVYDLAGRKLNPHALTPGLYIRDGKKFIKK